MFKYLLILVLLIGFNFLVWSIIGLIRNYDETRSEIRAKLARGKNAISTKWKFLNIVLVAGGSLILFGFSTRVIDHIQGGSLEQLPLFALIIIGMWLFFSFVGGFAVTRFSLVRESETAIATSFVFWLLLEGIQFAQNFTREELVLTKELIIVHAGALVVSILFAYVGSKTAIPLNDKSIKAQKKKKKAPRSEKIWKKDVAAVMAAYNEEDTLARTVESLKEVLPASNIFVGSDGSKDRTLEIGQSLGINIYQKPNSGKANTLRRTLEKYDILSRFKAVIFIDADSTISEDYLSHSLPIFNNNPEVAAVAVHATSRFLPHKKPSWEMFFAAYRVRFYRVLQAMFRYGQTWKYTCVSTIVPGFASIYRTSAVKHIDIDAPNLVIEDFNMTFEIHHKKLGRIGYSPKMKAVTIDPPNLFLYYKQIKRWNLGFWQTVRRHGFWPSKFWASLAPYIAEIVPLSLFFLIFTPFALTWFSTHSFAPFIVTLGTWSVSFTFLNLLVGIFVVDYLFTIATAIYERKPWILFYGLGFFFVRFVDAFVMLYTLPLAFTTKSTGAWIPPRKKNTELFAKNATSPEN